MNDYEDFYKAGHFITCMGYYKVSGKAKRLLVPRKKPDKRTKEYREREKLERAICEIDRILFKHGLSLTDLNFK